MINLSTLNVHYSIPVFGRPGRVLAFSYTLSVDSTEYTKASTTYFYWAPSWPVTSGVVPAAGVVYYTVSSYYCSTLHEYGQAVQGVLVRRSERNESPNLRDCVGPKSGHHPLSRR